MLETTLAVVFVSFVFLALFKLSYLLTGKILLEHAAMRVARARTVGFNDFMCRKTARVAVIPAAGRRTWPENADDYWDDSVERARVGDYLASEDEAHARGVLEYERWANLRVAPGDGTDVSAKMDFDLFDGAWTFDLEGEAGVEKNHALYLMDAGL
jgi:hypothetical protein